MTCTIYILAPYIKTDHSEEAKEILQLATDKVSKKHLNMIQKQQANLEQHYKGTTYTVHNMTNNTGLEPVPGWYMSSMIIYNDFIYSCIPDGTSADPAPLCRYNLTNPDSEAPTMISENVSPLDNIFIYNNILYCTHVDAVTYDHKGMSINLENLQKKEEAFEIVCGNEKFWISTPSGSSTNTLYCSLPKFDNTQVLPSQWTRVNLIGIYDEYIYFRQENHIIQISAANINATKQIHTSTYIDSSEGPVLLGNGIYYTSGNNNYLYRYDLRTHAESLYDISDINNSGYRLNLDQLLSEIEGKLYLKSNYNSLGYGDDYENTNGWELNLENGTIQHIGKWFES